ncbi:unnamed protein product [Didymodactylos carnosus]|uniref:Roadblock/LAMTOR2 domain-containing protein n=1 Tax=Didymodactylos carnosus TaxID=1234261 RepID=A0A813TYN9_9BILA|nr:unnamed protein product [Didymodactylos carnosus]CAF0822445.1 unnamed protein product [Didymodactylos carnosus]CAF3606769.1 unnamed protein product [Didymodactylos carnosus]CAF3606874.1 unnamed protein product [Didymodactylos carnosus]
MLKPKALSDVLAQVTGGGIQSTVLLTRDGALLAYSGFDGGKDAKIIAAMASSMWGAHQRSRTPSTIRNGVGSGDLNMILLDSEEGKLVISAVANQLLCMVSKPNVELGILKAKMDALTSYLQEPLRQVSQGS